MVVQRASFLSALDGFYFVMTIAVLCGVFAIRQRQID